jgi:hypothetical protein
MYLKGVSFWGDIIFQREKTTTITRADKFREEGICHQT